MNSFLSPQSPQAAKIVDRAFPFWESNKDKGHSSDAAITDHASMLTSKLDDTISALLNNSEHELFLFIRLADRAERPRDGSTQVRPVIMNINASFRLSLFAVALFLSIPFLAHAAPTDSFSSRFHATLPSADEWNHALFNLTEHLACSATTTHGRAEKRGTPGVYMCQT